jgi:hypothetical protein
MWQQITADNRDGGVVRDCQLKQLPKKRDIAMQIRAIHQSHCVLQQN